MLVYRPETATALGVQEQQQQTGLLHAFQLLLMLRHLDARLAHDQNCQLQLLTIGAGLHTDAGTLGLAHGAYLKTCLVMLAPFFAGELLSCSSEHIANST